MELKPVGNADIALIAEWMTLKENYQWLDFGNGTQILTAVSLKIMSQRDIHYLRLFTPDDDEVPAGLVGLSNINREFKTATLWYLLGNKKYSGTGLTRRAVARMLQVAFQELGLQAINAWVIEHNKASIEILKKNHFQPAGRIRQCHYIDGCCHDRLLFDILNSEFSSP